MISITTFINLNDFEFLQYFFFNESQFFWDIFLSFSIDFGSIWIFYCLPECLKIVLEFQFLSIAYIPSKIRIFWDILKYDRKRYIYFDFDSFKRTQIKVAQPDILGKGEQIIYNKLFWSKTYLKQIHMSK